MVEEAKSSGSRAQPYDADVLLVVATKVEARAVLELFEEELGNRFERRFIGGTTYFELGVISGARTFMVQSEMGSGGQSGSLFTIQEGIGALSPSAVIMVGIAFGIDERKQRIGEILVSRQLLAYELQRIGTGSDGKALRVDRGDRSQASPRLLDRFRSGEFDWKGPKVDFGLVLSGDKLVDNRDFRDQLREFEPDAIGGEMEGAGLYAAAQRSKVDWILVKAICDWADGKKHRNKRNRQQKAAHNAVSFVIHVMRQGGFAGNESVLRNPSVTTAQGRPSRLEASPDPALPAEAPLGGGGFFAYDANWVGRNALIYFSDEPRKPAANTAWPVTAPTPPQHFIGREHILEELRESLVMNQVIALQGMGGAGKTVTAKKLANEASVDFPGGVFWAALPDHDGKIMPILRTWLRSCGERLPEEKEADREKELIHYVRNVLTVRRIQQGPLLIIVDDVRQRWDEAAKSLQEALPDKTPLLITTQDMEVATALGRVIPLPDLSPSKALSLLKVYAGASIVEKDLQISQTLLEVLGYLPLAIELAGKRLALLAPKPGFDLATFAMAVEQRANEVLNLPGYPGLTAIFFEAYDALPAKAQRIFRTLGVFSARRLTLEGIASVSGMNVTEADQLLDKLVTASLLAWGEEERPYRLHPLLGQYAETLLKAEEKSQVFGVKRRHLHFCIAEWVKAMEQDFRGLNFLSNVLHDITENLLPEDVFRKFLEAMSKFWELRSPGDGLWGHVADILSSDPSTYLCQGPQVPLDDRKCSRILDARILLEHHIDLLHVGWPIGEEITEEMISLLGETFKLARRGLPEVKSVARGWMRGRLPFAFVTKSDSLYTLLSKTSREERGTVLQNNLGLLYYTDDINLVEIRYPESVMRDTRLTVPTCLDRFLDISRSVRAADGWGRSINLGTLADGLPEAVHPPIPFTDEFDVVSIGRVEPSGRVEPFIQFLEGIEEKALKNHPQRWSPESLTQLLEYVDTLGITDIQT